MNAKPMDRDEYDAGVAEREVYAARLRNRPKLTPERIRARIANPKQRMPVTGNPIDPRLKMDVMTETENLLSSGPSGTPTLATDQQVSAVLASMTSGEHLPVAEGQPWERIVAKAVDAYDLWFHSAPDRRPIGHDMPPTDLDEYDARWNARPPKLDLFTLDNLPVTHDNTDTNGDVLPPWNPGVELAVSVVVSTSRDGHRWLVRGTTTVESVLETVRSDKHCDLSYRRCTARTDPSEANVFAFNHGDLTVISHVCAECWQQWADEHVPEPLSDTEYF